MSRSFPQILSSECGGSPEEYEASLEDMRSLDEAAADEEEIDMSADDVPAEFDELNLDEAEEIVR